jgi:acyl-[acyl carrier protein]--UDP-N-acetylglucosamine O-acyltransferase
MSFDPRFDTVRVNNNVVVLSTISVTGPSNITGLTTMNSTLSVQGDVYMTSNLSIGHDLFANQCTLNSLITSSLSVYAIVSGTVTLQEDLTILDDLVVHDTLSVGGQTTLSSTLSVVSHVTFRSTLSVGNNVVISTN